jgi:hypothetical protein
MGFLAREVPIRCTYTGAPSTPAQKLELNIAMVEAMQPLMVGLPVIREYDDGNVIGLVTQSRLTAANDWEIYFNINSEMAINWIERGWARGLALTHSTTPLRPLLVAIVETPAREGAYVKAVVV